MLKIEAFFFDNEVRELYHDLGNDIYAYEKNFHEENISNKICKIKIEIGVASPETSIYLSIYFIFVLH